MTTHELFDNDSARYFKMCAIFRDTGFTMLWHGDSPTGRLSCWERGGVAMVVQELRDGCEVYSNQETPRTFREIAEWLNPC